MKILAIESTGRAASVAVCDGERFLSQYYQNSGLTHSRTLLVMAENMLKNLDLTLNDVDLIAVANGPGSFTGVRIGVSAAKGLAWGAGKQVCGVSSLEALAHLAGDFCGIICPVMDARRSQVYNAKFSFSGQAPIRLCPDRALSVSDLIEEAREDEKPYFLIGDGAELCYNQFAECGLDVRLAPVAIRLQSAFGVARAALTHEAVSPHDLIPNYIRLSQAERERLHRAEKI
jgi:tRNA threonylcarbamoyladenosine biosynthesis protein TsaB